MEPPVASLEQELLRLPSGTTDRVLARMRTIPQRQHPYFDDPVGWIRDRLGEDLWSKQRAIAESVVANRHTASPSAHDTGKSYIASRICCWWIDTRPIGDAFVVTSAPSQSQVKSILWREIRRAHRKGSLPGWITQGQIPEWKIGDDVVAFGRKPADSTSDEEAMAAFQGIHDRYVLVVLDEGGGIPKWLYDAGDALATNEHARVLVIGNPDDPASHFAEICKPGSKFNVIPISAFDTPAFTGEKVDPRLLELLVSEVYVGEMRLLGEDSWLYQSKVLGRFPDVSDDTVFPPRLLNRATAHELSGIERGGYGVDVARKGDDETCVYRNRGGVIRLVDSWRKKDTEDTADRVEAILATHGAAQVPAMIDAVGIGAGVYDKLRRRDMPALEFGGGERALQPDRYVNRRAEVLWELRLAIEDGRVDLDPNDKELLAQLGRIKYRQVSGGRIQIESKDDMRKRGVKSPDRADAAAMAFACPPLRPIDEELAAAAAGAGLMSQELMEEEW
jgi:hypothetical protein